MIKDHLNIPHYKWGNNCHGWLLVQSGQLSIIQEKMPAGTAEQFHYHEHAQQFFFILKGVASFEMDGRTYQVDQGQGIHIPPKCKHRIANHTQRDLEFLVTSQPKSHGDRFLV